MDRAPERLVDVPVGVVVGGDPLDPQLCDRAVKRMGLGAVGVEQGEVEVEEPVGYVIVSSTIRHQSSLSHQG